MLNSLKNRRWSFVFIILLVHTTIPTISTKNPSSTFNFYLPILILLVQKLNLTTTTNIPFLYTSAILHVPIFAYNYFNNLHQRYFPYLSHLANSGCFKGPGSWGGGGGGLVKTNAVLFSPFVLKVWTVIAGFTITDSLSLRLRKLMYCR